jgi:hypothetical protein
LMVAPLAGSTTLVFTSTTARVDISVRSSICSKEGRKDFLGRAEFLRKWANFNLSKKRTRRGAFAAALLAATSSLRWLHHGCATKQDRFFPAN